TYAKLKQLGEKGIEDAQRQYGSLAAYRDMLRAKIVRSELAEARKPSYSGIPLRSATRHPLLTGGLALGEAIRPEAWPALGPLPALETIRTFMERAGTPNTLLRKSLEAYRGGPQYASPIATTKAGGK